MLSLSLSLSASAATLVVDTTSDTVASDGVTSLREALQAAQSGDVITFDATVFPSGTTTSIGVIGSTLTLGVAASIIGENRVVLDGSAAPAGTSGLRLSAPAQVTGLELVDFPYHGILTDEVGVSLSENTVRRSGRDGLMVGVTVSLPFEVDANTVVDSCQSPSGACAGIHLYKSPPIGPQGLVTDNTVTGTLGDPALGQGTGILVAAGLGTRVLDNTVRTNTGTGIVVASPTNNLSGTVLSGNLASANGKNGILLSAGSSGSTVTGNRVGTTAGGGAADPNGNHGIYVFGVSNLLIDDNVVSGNAQSGIRLAGAWGGIWQSGHVITNNRVGTGDSGMVAVPNGDAGIWSSGEGGESEIGGNILSGNDGPGLRLEDGGHVVQANVIGLNSNGYGLGNGGGPGGPTAAVELLGGSILFGDIGPWPLGGLLPGSNVVSSNSGDGVLIGPGGALTEVLGNVVGLAEDGLQQRANLGDGIVIDGASLVTVGLQGGGNIIGKNGGAGIRIASTAGPTTWPYVTSNLVGQNLAGDDKGNAGDGIVIEPGPWALGPATLEGNHVRASGGVGIRVLGGSAIDLSRNRIEGSAACGLLVSGGDGASIPPPVVEGRSAMTIWGTVSPPPGTTAQRVEVFWDDEDEAREYLGRATLLPDGHWQLDATSVSPFPFEGRVVATLHVTGNVTATSGFPPGCGDGCSAAGTGSCNDGNVCTTEVCDPGTDTCVFSDNNGATCQDGNACTTGDTCQAGACTPGSGSCQASSMCDEQIPNTDVWIQRDCTVEDTDTNPCNDRYYCSTTSGECERDKHNLKCFDEYGGTADNCDTTYGCVHPELPAGMACDDGNACTGLGLADPAGSCLGSEPIGCPLEHGWSVGTCDPVDGCTYEGIDDPPGAAYCGPDELCLDPFGDCAEVMGWPAWIPWDQADGDGDGLPDVWEEASGADLDGDGIVDVPLVGADPDVPDIFVEVDFMVAADHRDEIPEGYIIDMVATFLALQPDEGKVESYQLHVDVDDELPHHTYLVTQQSTAPASKQCADWVAQSDIKQQWFDPRRRGFYHYVVVGHEGCGGVNGTGELGGDDITIMLATDHDDGTFTLNEGALFHELGHNLGLSHGGYRNRGGQPNYQSCMNGKYGLIPYGIPPTPLDVRLDYSAVQTVDLDEAHLEEPWGVFMIEDPEYWVRHSCQFPGTSGPIDFWEPKDAIDWDCDGVIEAEVAADLDGDGRLTTLSGRDDWATLNLRFACQQDGDFFDNRTAEVPEELTPEDLDEEGWSLDAVFPAADLIPGCVQNPIAADGTGAVQLLVPGSAELDVTQITSLALAGAVPTASRTLDWNGDQLLDVVYAFDTADLDIPLTRDWTRFWGRTATGQVLFGQVGLQWVPTTWDTSDQDGVDEHYGCDQCPGLTAPPASPDGCL